jgi:putative membrane protein
MNQRSVKDFFYLMIKGAGMGAANVIPGVSGGTIALITNIFEELIDSIKSFDVKAIKLLLNGKFRAFSEYVNLWFLIAVFLGVGLSIISLAKLLEFLFAVYPVYVWSYFFGLIIASVYFVGRTVHSWKPSVVVSFIVGTTIAAILSFLNPATENSSLLYLFICGIFGVVSMIIPGLSGSFILILMGNYELIIIHAVSHFRIDILGPVVLGGVFGLIAFSHLLSWIFKNFRDHTIATLTGFILGSVTVLWPWKNEIYKTGADGEYILKISGEKVVAGYNLVMPETLDFTVVMAASLIILGVVSIYTIEKIAEKK